MAKKRIPSRAEFPTEWAKLDKDGRKRVRRAANRAQPATNRKEAALAVVFARNQQRTGKWMAPIGALIVGVLQIPDGVEAVVRHALVGLVLFSVVAFIFIRRARKAEAVNLAVVEGTKRRSE